MVKTGELDRSMQYSLFGGPGYVFGLAHGSVINICQGVMGCVCGRFLCGSQHKD